MEEVHWDRLFYSPYDKHWYAAQETSSIDSIPLCDQARSILLPPCLKPSLLRDVTFVAGTFIGDILV